MKYSRFISYDVPFERHTHTWHQHFIATFPHRLWLTLMLALSIFLSLSLSRISILAVVVVDEDSTTSLRRLFIGCDVIHLGAAWPCRIVDHHKISPLPANRVSFNHRSSHGRLQIQGLVIIYTQVEEIKHLKSSLISQ